MVFFKLQVNCVRIFKALFFLVHYFVNAQTESDMLNELKKSGRWGDYFLREDSEFFKLVSQDIVVDSLVFIGDSSLHFSTMSNIFNPIKESTTSAVATSRFQELQDSHLFISSNSALIFARYGSANIAAVIDIKTDFKSYIGGIIGSNKDRTGNWKLNGEIDLQLENLLKNGSSFSLFWKQPSSAFRLLTFEAEYPVFSKFPFGLSAIYDQEFYENFYINESFSSHLSSIGKYGKLKIGSKAETSNNLEISKVSKTRSASIILQRDRRNTRWLPYFGSFWEMGIDLGKYKDHIGNALQLNTNFHFGTFKSYRSSLLYFMFSGSLNQIEGRNEVLTQFINFGGSNSIRGYAENQFKAEWMSLQSVELIFGDFSRSQFFIFLDNALAKDIKINPSSGFGIRVFDGKFYYDVSLGFPLEGLREAKLHIKFNTRL